MKSKRTWAALAGILISAVFLWFAFRNLNPAAVGAEIQTLEIGWIALAAVVYFGAVSLISLRWQFLLRAVHLIHLRALIPLVAIGYTGNNIFPFRSGEVLRILLLQRRHAVPLARAATTVVVERAFDGIVMLSFILAALLLVDVRAPEVQRVALAAAPVFIGAAAVFFVLAARPTDFQRLVRLVSRRLPGPLAARAQHIGDDIGRGLEGLRSPLHLLGAVVSSYASWMVEALVYWLVSFAFGLELSYPVMLLVVGVVNLAGLIPASPGQIGVFEFFVSLVLIAVGVAEPQAHAYALVVHLVIWLPVTLLGFFFLARMGLGVGEFRVGSLEFREKDKSKEKGDDES